MRLVSLIALALLAAPAFADSPGIKPEKPAERPAVPGQEAGIYRFGATYSVLASDTAGTCQEACSDDGACFAWSYVAGAGDAGARCELKRGGGRVMRDALAVSGISSRHEDLYEVHITLPDALAGGPDETDD